MRDEVWQRSMRRRFEAAAIAVVGYRVVAGIGATLSWRTEGLEHYDRAIAAGTPPILGFWHGRILPATVYFRDRGIVVMTSRNFDGEWIARIITKFGYGTARGSSTRGGPQALREMIRALRQGQPAGFTLDGPKGPARSVQPGALWLAAATGHPLLPFHLEAARAWTAPSWDATQVPKPFSTVALVVGEPLHVPRDTEEAGLLALRGELEERLARLEARAREMLSAPDARA